MDLLRRFALGEIEAFETLVRQFQGDIYAWTVRIVRDPGIAEDLTVETLRRIYRAHQQFRPDGNFAAWARRIATNLALDHLRRKRPEQSLLAEPAGTVSTRSTPPAGDMGEDPAGISPLAGQTAGGGDARSCGRAALRRNCRCPRDVGRRREAACFPRGTHPA